MGTRFSLAAALASLPAALAVLTACGTAASGGVALVGGPPGTACDTQYMKQGCYLSTRVECVADAAGTTPNAGKWSDIGACTSNQYCVEETNPANPVQKLAVCKDLPTQTADTTSGQDTTTGNDTSLTDVSAADVAKCVQQKCSSQYTACMAAPTCSASVTCNLNCGDNEACQDNCPVANFEDPVVAALFGCVMDSGCVPRVPDTVCGDGTCEGTETAQNCPQDCQAGPVCGNGTCESGENTQNCSQDCKSGPVCGNGTCESGENSENCTPDCPPEPYCGDGQCNGNETKNSCPSDCGSPGPVCFNEICEEGESWQTCPSDCQKPVICGDGTCEGNETTSNCPTDCKAAAKCGDGTCSGNENTQSCAMDCATSQYGATIQCGWSQCKSAMTACGNKPACVQALNCLANCNCDQACAESSCSTFVNGALSELGSIYTCAEQAECPSPCPDAAICGDGICNGTETSSSCPDDCPVAPKCGDGICNGTETTASCAKDCPSSGSHVCNNSCGSSYTNPSTGVTCYCDSTCKSNGDCCNATGTSDTSSSCAGSTCSSCK